MKKILITARHSGPLEAVISLIPILQKEFEVILLVTDSAKKVFLDRHHGISAKVKVFVPGKKTFVNLKYIDKEKGLSFKTEFLDSEISEYKNFQHEFSEFLLELHPDFGIRTTPSDNWGVDEILPTLMNNLFDASVFCYQEYYLVGQGFVINKSRGILNLPKLVFTVDFASTHMFKEKNISTYTLGWLAHKKFENYKNYSLSKKEGKEIIGIGNEKLILYACNATGNLSKEINEFSDTVKSIRDQVGFQYKLAIRFHPRHTSSDIQKYINAIAQLNIDPIILDENFSYSHILSAPDYIISLASYLNIEALAYQASWIPYNNLSEFSKNCTMSIYIYDDFTKSIFKKVFSKLIIPSHQIGAGNIIVNDINNLGTTLNQFNRDLGLRTKFLSESYHYINMIDEKRFIEIITKNEELQ